jgi:hypothetical protein
MQRRGLNTGVVLNIKRRVCLLCTFRGLVPNAFPRGDWEEDSCPFVPHVQSVFTEIISVPQIYLKLTYGHISGSEFAVLAYLITV